MKMVLPLFGTCKVSGYAHLLVFLIVIPILAMLLLNAYEV